MITLFCIFQASPNASTRSSSFSVNSPASPSEYESRSEQDPNCRKYNIALTEFETGMTYNMEGLYVSKWNYHHYILIFELETRLLKYKINIQAMYLNYFTMLAITVSYISFPPPIFLIYSILPIRKKTHLMR